MSTAPDTMAFILEKLASRERFAARAMFGEYALYADGKTVALVCNDQLYVKIVPASARLESVCEQDTPYPGAKLHYVVAEDQLDLLDDLPDILFAIAAALPAKKEKKKSKKKQYR